MMAAERAGSGVTLARLLAGIVEAPPVEVAAIALDSRAVTPGAAFLACQGLTVHGLTHLHQALRLGARVVLWEPAEGVEPPTVPAGITALPVPQLGKQAGRIAARFYGEPSRQLRVCGVTGTNGKTSCSQLLAQALTRRGSRCGVLGTLGYGLYGDLEPGLHTTPDAVRMQSLLAQFRDAGAGYASLEVSSHALDQGRVAGTRFAVALFTNLSRDHLDYHGDLVHYAAAKQKLFLSEGLGWAVVNRDDETGRAILRNLPAGVHGIAYGLQPPEAGLEQLAQLYAERLTLHDRGMTLGIAGSFGSGTLEARLLGRFNAQNLLAVLGALLALDIPLAEALELLAASETVPGRMECFGGGSQPLVVVDYAHTPDALRQALTAARAHCRGRLLCVFGCGGDRDRGKRPEMGALAEALADRVIVTDDNPRTESPQAIVAEILAGVAQRDRVQVEHDRAGAIAQALGETAPGDVVLVAGKGHEDYQLVGTEKRAYSDRDTVRRLLGEAA